MLVKTSNPSSGEFQDRLVDGRPLYEIVGEKSCRMGQRVHGQQNIAMLVRLLAQPILKWAKALRKVMPKSYILVPGYGAQGGKGR